MLELRESWKMEILKPFSHIRFLILEIGKRSKLFEDINYLGIQEIIEKEIISPNQVTQELKERITQRKQQAEVFKLYSFPTLVTFKQVEQAISGNYTDEDSSLDGEPISPGVVYGTVKIIKDAKDFDVTTLPKDAIIVAESTDPGWVSIFTKSVGIIVEKGGILSHSAIVAREMGIPAVSGIKKCMNKLKDGQKICLDGDNGHISYELN